MREIILVTCSGISNTGRLTTQTAVALIRRNPEMFEEHIQVSNLKQPLDRALSGAASVVVLDGCTDCCGLKKIPASVAGGCIHIIATDCGIEKAGMRDPEFDEILRLSNCVMEAIRR